MARRAERPRERSRWWARCFAIAGLLAALAAVWLVVSLVWGEPITGYIAAGRQDSLRREWQAEHKLPVVHSSACPAVTAGRYRPGVGQPYALLTIPVLDLHRTVVVEGTENVGGQLEAGPGHYPATRNPCGGGTTAIAGHRTTWGAWFRHIDDLAVGDSIYLTMPYGRFRYVVTGHRVVLPSALWIARSVGFDRLVLSACEPLYSASHRYVVFARLEGEHV